MLSVIGIVLNSRHNTPGGIILIHRALAAYVILKLVERPICIVLVRICKTFYSTYSIPYFIEIFKFIVRVFFYIPVSIGDLIQLAVI